MRYGTMLLPCEAAANDGYREDEEEIMRGAVRSAPRKH